MMSATKQLSCVALLAVSAIGAGVGNASQQPPTGSKSLTEIVTAFEGTGCQIVEVSFDEGRWELEGYRNGMAYELEVNPETGLLMSMRRDDIDSLPPTGAKTLSQILAEVTKSGCTKIVSAELEHGYWEVEAYRDLAKRELHLDPISGAILTEHAD